MIYVGVDEAEVDNASDDQFIKWVFTRPDILIHPSAVNRLRAVLKSLSYSPEEKRRDSLREAFKNALQRKGGKHRPPDEINTRLALGLMARLAMHLRKKIRDFCHYYYWQKLKNLRGESAPEFERMDVEFDQETHSAMRSYFSECNPDPRISALSYEDTRLILRGTKACTAYIDKVIDRHLGLTKKSLEIPAKSSEK
jgi:hypothetical protein